MFYRHLYLLLILILGFLCYGSAETKECEKLLHQLADAQMQFVGCMVRNSSPAQSCVDCYYNHTTMIEKYTHLVLNPNCSKEILHENRLDIVYNVQKNLVDIWNKGFCDDCFSNNTISNETKSFLELFGKFKSCIEENTITPCVICNGKYADLNNFYKQMDEAKQGQICFDTQDKMNRTRSLWSKNLNCCHREYNLTFFIIASLLFAALPIVFYFGMYGYTKRMERNHEVLDAGLNTGHASTSTGAQSGTTSHIEEGTSRRYSSSDEDIIDNLKKQRDISSFENTAKPNSVHPEKINTLKPSSSTRPTSSNEIGTLIEL